MSNESYRSHDGLVQVITDYEYLADLFTITGKVYTEVMHTTETGFEYYETELSWEHSEHCNGSAFDNGEVDNLCSKIAGMAEKAFATINGGE